MLKQDSVLERLMLALDLALGLRMIRRSADMLDVLLVQPIGKIARDGSVKVTEFVDVAARSPTRERRSMPRGRATRPRQQSVFACRLAS